MVLALYYPSWKSGFDNEFLDYSNFQKSMSLKDYLLLPKSSLYQGVNLVHYILNGLFSTHRIFYYLTYCLLHSIVGLLSYRFFTKLAAYFIKVDYRYFALAGSIIFMLSPLCNEVVIWKVCSHYLISAIFLLVILTWLLDYIKSGKSGLLIAGLALYYISTFFLEYFFLTPFFALFSLLAFLLRKENPIGNSNAKKALVRFLLPMVLLFCIYFITFKIVIGKGIARVENLDKYNPFTISTILSDLGIFTTRTFIPDFIFKDKIPSKIYPFFYKDIGRIVVFIVIGIPALLGLIYYRKLSSKLQLTYLIFIITCFSFSLIVPLYYYNPNYYIGSRYFYLSCIFSSQLILLILSFFKQKWIIISGFIFLVCLNVALSFRNIRMAKRTMVIVDNILNQVSTEWPKNDTFLFLSLPVTYDVAHVIGSTQEYSYVQLFLYALKNDTLTGHAYDVASFNMHKLSDGVRVNVKDSLHLQVWINDDGNWFHNQLIGLGNYETNIYKVTVLDNAVGYELELKKPVGDNTVLLFYNERKLKRVNMKLFNVDQR